MVRYPSAQEYDNGEAGFEAGATGELSQMEGTDLGVSGAYDAQLEGMVRAEGWQCSLCKEEGCAAWQAPTFSLDPWLLVDLRVAAVHVAACRRPVAQVATCSSRDTGTMRRP